MPSLSVPPVARAIGYCPSRSIPASPGKRGAQADTRLERRLEQLTYPMVLIVDEMGYLRMSHQQARSFFRLITRARRRRATS